MNRGLPWRRCLARQEVLDLADRDSLGEEVLTGRLLEQQVQRRLSVLVTPLGLKVSLKLGVGVVVWHPDQDVPMPLGHQPDSMNVRPSDMVHPLVTHGVPPDRVGALDKTLPDTSFQER